MRGVSFIASMGLRVLISNARSLDLKGRRMVLFGATEMVHGVLDDAALNQIIPIVRTERDALAVLAS
jgi:anti-anti-sigma factor